MATNIPVALEMYSVRHQFTENPLATMKAVKEMGYDGVEFAGKPQFCPEFYAALLKETGLTCCGWHTPWELVQENTLAETIRLNKLVNNPNIIVPWLNAKTHQDWENYARQFNDLAGKLALVGMRTGYHNHSHEFADLDGKTPWDTFMGNTDKKVVMQLDTGNALKGGCDILATLNKYPGRCQTIHLKPYSKDPEKGFKPIIGDDDCPWKEIFEFCKTKGNTEWYVIEYECPEIPALEAVKLCLDATRKLLAE
ncbi:MAG: sugar phosphate isomerase/epimerase [Lentisphaerae bacterium]|jgi:sugar phosphate isomerase/epimerase|nr:sugar phosphate isomerase/epimerase [Lentisphaerota bacterium]